MCLDHDLSYTSPFTIITIADTFLYFYVLVIGGKS